MLSFERLTARNKNGLAYLVNVKPNEQEVDSPHKNTLKCILDCFERLAQYEEEAIARQSVKSEEVAEAIAWHDNQRAGCAVSFKNFDKEEKHFKLAVLALRQMRSEPCWWVQTTNGRCGYECSVCHAYAPSYQNGEQYLSPYCPSCGARMVK